MNKYFKKVLSVLRTKAKQLGLNYKELKGVAAKIADNLELEENASDEDVNSAIENAVDDAMEYLSVSQSAAQRAIANYKAKHNISDDDDDDDANDGEGDDDDATTNDANGKKGKKNGRHQRNHKSDDDEDDEDNTTPKWAKSLTTVIEQLSKKVSLLEQGKVSGTRRSKLEKLLKDTGKFGERKLRDFDRIADTFKNEEEFEKYLDDVSEDLDEYNQERADAGLSKLGQPGAGSPKNKGGEDADKPKEITDEELEDLANQL